jgi:hypothetical protein
MYKRNKVLAIESIVVMFVLILLSFVVFIIIRSGSGAYKSIISQKQNTESARVAYSYINMKIKQNDSQGLVSVVGTQYGSSLRLDTADGEFSTYIFFSDGTLYECLTRKGSLPEADAANRITALAGFQLSSEGSYINITCISESGGSLKTFKGTVGLRT